MMSECYRLNLVVSAHSALTIFCERLLVFTPAPYHARFALRYRATPEGLVYNFGGERFSVITRERIQACGFAVFLAAGMCRPSGGY